MDKQSRNVMDKHVGKIVGTVAMVNSGEKYHNPDVDIIVIHFTDNTAMQVRDDGQSCCERRYMRTDDELGSVVGGVFLGVEIRDVPRVDRDAACEAHEVQFFVVRTDRGNLVFSSHNEHNGWYGGFNIVLE